MSARPHRNVAEAAHAAEEIAAGRERLQDGHDRVAFELVPILAALELLANSQRALRDIEFTATLDGDLRARLNASCPTWGDPIDATLHGFDVMNDLSRVARLVAQSIAADIDPDAKKSAAT